MPHSKRLVLSEDVESRILAAASVLRLSPDAFLARVLSQHFNTLGGLPLELLRYIWTFLDYSTISSVVTRVSHLWNSRVSDAPLHCFSRLRQVHGIHLLDPAHGIWYYPRALKRVIMGQGASTSATAASSSSSSSVSSSAAVAAPSRGRQGGGAPLEDATSFFLTVSIRAQSTTALPWTNIRESVESAILMERLEYGVVRSAGLLQPKGPVLSLSASVVWNRSVYVFGGETAERLVLDTAYLYCPFKKRWSALPPLREKRAAATAAVFCGSIYIFGGYNSKGEVLDSYEVFHPTMRRWGSQLEHPSPCKEAGGDVPATAATSLPPLDYRMPTRICGAAATAYRDIIVLVGGHQRCNAAQQTAMANSGTAGASPTPMHGPTISQGEEERGGTGTASRGNEGAATEGVITPRMEAMPRTALLSNDGPTSAEDHVWVFSPYTGQWWTEGPRLPSPRAFGAVVVLQLPILGHCLCYFGGCAKADVPETALLYIPLQENPSALAVQRKGDAERGPLHYFRDTARLPWQQYVRIPLGGAFTSIAVIGTTPSRTLVLTGVYPAPSVGYCKVRELLPTDVLTSLMRAVTPLTNLLPPSDVDEGGVTKAMVQAAEAITAVRTSDAAKGTMRHRPSLPPLSLDADTPAGVTAADAHLRHPEQDWDAQQRHEVRELMRSAAQAAVQRRPRAPHTAGQENIWKLAPVPEVQVRDSRGAALPRVSWRVQAINAKTALGME